MKFTRPRTVLAGIIAAAAVAVPISLTVALPGTGPSVASPAVPPPPDTIVYAEGKGASSNFIQYTNNRTNPPTVTTQSVTSGGGCSSPTIHGTPLLNLAAYVYTYGTAKPNPPNASVGAYQGRTGVCGNNLPGSGQPNYAINNGSNSASGPAEALDFGIGSNNLVSGRAFSNALLNIVNASGPAAGTQVTLVETLNGAPVPSPDGASASTQTCNIASGATIAADTSVPAGGPCNGDPAGAFDDIEIQVTTPNASVSVTGPTSTFTLVQQQCAGDNPLPDTGPIPATLNVSAGCKSYTTFSSTQTNAAGQQEVDFNSLNAGGPILFTTTITWNPEPLCDPGSCRVTQVSYVLNGVNVGPVGAPACAPTNPLPEPICITNSVYNNIVDPVSGQPETQVTQTFANDVDSAYRH